MIWKWSALGIPSAATIASCTPSLMARRVSSGVSAFSVIRTSGTAIPSRFGELTEATQGSPRAFLAGLWKQPAPRRPGALTPDPLARVRRVAVLDQPGLGQLVGAGEREVE